MSSAPVTIRIRKAKSNPLLGRKQFVVEAIHPGQANVSKAKVSEKLASMFKVKDTKCIVTFGFHTAFGGGKSSGMGLIYENVDKMKRFEPRYRLKRAGVEFQTKILRIGRRNLKKMKGNLKKGALGKKQTEIKKTAGAGKNPTYKRL